MQPSIRSDGALVTPIYGKLTGDVIRLHIITVFNRIECVCLSGNCARHLRSVRASIDGETWTQFAIGDDIMARYINIADINRNLTQNGITCQPASHFLLVRSTR